MLNDFAKEWVAALRSGQYKQGYNLLKQDSPEGPLFCCLGVACDLAVKDGFITERQSGNAAESYFYDGHHEQNLSLRMCTRLGLNNRVGSYLSAKFGTPRCLSDDNDGFHRSFAEIADIIESEPEGLFEKA